MKFQAACRCLMMHLMMLLASGVDSPGRKSFRGLRTNRKQQDAPTVKLGMNVMLTNHETRGDEVQRVTDMWKNAIGEDGGIQVGGTGQKVDLIILDNENDIEIATKHAQELIDQGVLAAVGPYWSTRAIPAGEVANNGNTTMISATSTNPATTLDRPYVFRAAFLDSFQGPMIAKFVSENYDFKNVAIVHECDDTYSSGLAGYFKQAWESEYGGTVSLDTCVDASKSEQEISQDVSSTAAGVAQSGAEFLFLPTFAEVGLQMIQELYALPEWTSPSAESRSDGASGKKLIVGGDATVDSAALAQCLESCEGVIAVKLFDPSSADQTTQQFVSDFASAYAGLVPTDAEALTWDALNLIKNAVETCGRFTGDLAVDRECVKDAMAATTDFPGVAGAVTFDSQGDPQKCVNFVQVVSGERQPLSQSCPA